MRDKGISRLSKSNTVPQTKFARRRGPTPEQLRSEDEREFEKAEKKDEKQAEKAARPSVYRPGNREKQEGEVAEGADSTARPSSKGQHTISSLVPSPLKRKSKLTCHARFDEDLLDVL